MFNGMLLYIDPGTGGMLFTILFGMIGTTFYFLRSLSIKLKFMSGRDSGEKINNVKIPIAIFSDHKRYWNVFEPICDELERRKQHAVYFTASADDPALEKDYEYIDCKYLGDGNKAFSKLNLLSASIVLSTTPHLDVFQWKRSKTVDYYIHIPHAASDISIYRMFGIDYYDGILLSGQYQIKQVRQLEELRGLKPKDLVIVGIPYMDEMRKRIYHSLDTSLHDMTTILMAPSWGKSSLLSRFGSRLIDALIETGYKIIIRPHPQSFISEKEMLEKLMKDYPESSMIQWNRDNDNFDVLNKSDLLISDFSGVIFDFCLVFDKPVIYADTSFDKSPYDCAWIEDELWTFSVLPKIGKQLNENNIENIKDIIDDCIKNPVYQQGRDEARSETWANIGEGTRHTVDYLIDQYNTIIHKTEGDRTSCQ